MAVPAKILLKSSTKMSLSDRFSKLPAPTTAETVRTLAAQESQASAKNRRLAMQMENRPSVKAALGISPLTSPTVQPTMRLQPQRLNAPQGRLPQQMQRLMPQPQQHQLMQLEQRLPAQQRLSVQQRITPRQVPLQQRLGRSNVKARLSLPQQQTNFRGRGNFVQRGRGMQRGVNRGGSYSLVNNRRGGGVQRGGVQRGGFNRGRGRGGVTRGNRGNYRGRGRGGGPKVTAESLNNQLDEYMSKTKNSLDSELDAYMAETQD